MAGIIERHYRLGSAAVLREMIGLSHLVGSHSSLDACRKALADQLWEGRRSIAEPSVASHLVQTVRDQLLIDQPTYAAPPLTG